MVDNQLWEIGERVTQRAPLLWLELSTKSAGRRYLLVGFVSSNNEFGGAGLKAGSSMIKEDDEKAQLLAHLRFISGQVNMLMDLCVTFISCNSDPEKLAQRFEATVKSTLSHTDVKLTAQEFLDGELDIVNQVRLNVISALPKAFQREKLPVLLAASTINADADKAGHAKLRASHALEALTVEWMEKASELEASKLLSLSSTPPDTA